MKVRLGLVGDVHGRRIRRFEPDGPLGEGLLVGICHEPALFILALGAGAVLVRDDLLALAQPACREPDRCRSPPRGAGADDLKVPCVVSERGERGADRCRPEPQTETGKTSTPLFPGPARIQALSGWLPWRSPLPRPGRCGGPGTSHLGYKYRRAPEGRPGHHLNGTPAIDRRHSGRSGWVPDLVWLADEHLPLAKLRIGRYDLERAVPKEVVDRGDRALQLCGQRLDVTIEHDHRRERCGELRPAEESARGPGDMRPPLSYQVVRQFP